MWFGVVWSGLGCFGVVWGVSTDRPLSLFGRSYTYRYRALYLRNAIAVPCNKRTDDIWSENQATNQKCKGPKFG